MMPNTFISYSRQCIGFVDDLAHKLEKQGFKIWTDYLSLVPGRPWAEQIHNGLAEAELLLLVVSPESISSRSVELEWRHFLEHKKRIILLVFQAVPLPPELAGLEWIDFRGAFAPALKKLLQRIESPTPMEKPAPQSGFKAPAVVWLAGALSVITAVYSLFAFWTFLIPWVLIPLPFRIFKRNFNLSQVQTALWTLSVALFFSFGLSLELGVVNVDVDFDYSNYFSLYNFTLLILFLQIYLIPLLSILLLFVLRLPAMQRWGRPEASVPKFANIYHPNILQPKPVHYHIDHAPQDGVIARALAAELKKYGHTPAEGLASADEVLVLLSRFKTDTAADPEKQVVYPILIQRVKLPEKLSKVQWIDFRKGVRNLEAIAQLLPQPAKLLAALGVRPTSSGQTAMPNIVLALVDFLIIMGMVDLGSFIAYMLELTNLNLRLVAEYESFHLLQMIFMQLIGMVFSGWLIYFMVRSLSERYGWFAKPGAVFLGLVTVLGLFFWQFLLGEDLNAWLMKYGILSQTMFSAIPFIFMFFGGFIVGAMVLFRIKALRFWFPAK
ncbi:MAG: toll/interleukin-1 receptor domain-containing protein [Chloroflexi bacterium]|nr:toll/interleukin-1 receptor domain-containing protein [Chloroflexota bacterium]MBI3169543.1 toll/interleukin-1 receptor domain-containing protein [Chloroflexota bacterium]